MGCGAAEATGLGFVCFAIVNPRVLSANRVDLGLFFRFFQILPPPPSPGPGDARDANVSNSALSAGNRTGQLGPRDQHEDHQQARVYST